MGKVTIPSKTSTRLWGKAGGRCEFDGCNQALWKDEVTKFEFNTSYIAHIVAEEPNGPRGNELLSPLLAKDINNLMLLCDTHHRLIDKVDVEGHPVEGLQDMKRRHEERIEILTGISADKSSQIVLYGANVGEHSPVLNYRMASNAFYPEFYPASTTPIQLSLVNSLGKDNSPDYWELQEKHLSDQVEVRLRSAIRLAHISHLSIFALAPQPLLIKFGILLNDLHSTVVYQKHREPDTWRWQERENIEHFVQETTRSRQIVAVNFSLSATVTNDRIEDVLGSDCSIYTLSHSRPNNDYLKTKQILSDFRVQVRRMLDHIKAAHGHNTVLHVFPAMPNSAAIEFGRVWMPKADMRMVIYDENQMLGGFVKALEINPTT